MDILYDIAKNEYSSEGDDGRHKLVYAYFGLAIYFGQCLEETFSIMLWTDRIFKKKPKTNTELNEIIDSIENSKKTMGKQINEVKQNYTLTDIQVDKLGKILNRRNYLAHKYFKLHIEKFYSETGQLEMIKYFCDFIDDSKQVDEELKVYYAKYTKRLGLTDEKIVAYANEMKLQELKRTEI